MPRYFFHIRMDLDWHDEEGLQLPDLAAARRGAIEGARQIANGLEADAVHPDHCIIIENDRGCTLMTVPFRAALKMQGSHRLH